MRNWRLGLDVGTASVGAVAIELDREGVEVAVPWHHVRIFAEPNEKGQTGLTPKKAGRRQARQQRRQLERRARRVRKIGHLAPLLGLNPAAVPPDGRKGQQLPTLRAKAAREKIPLDDLLRVLLRMAKRRGYAGGFRGIDEKDPKDDRGVVRTGSTELTKAMGALARERNLSSVTLGEFLAYRQQSGLPTRLKVDREGLPNLYALRDMLETEFEQVWSVQAAHHQSLNRRHEGRPVKNWFKEALFYQRPLKSPAAAVGLCPLEKSLPRSPRAQMAAQAFRIEKTLADLRWGAGRLAVPLTGTQRDVIRRALNDPEKLTKKGELSFKKIYKLLEAAGCPKPDGRALNLDRASREEIRGNTTLVAFAALDLLPEWQSLTERDQTSVINLLADLGSPEQLDPDDWHQRFLRGGARPTDKDRFRNFSLGVIGFINDLRVAPGYRRFSQMGFQGGRMAYSVKALTRLTEWLKDPHWRDAPDGDTHVDETSAIGECYPQARERAQSKGALPPAPITGNDTVDVALAQIQWTIADGLAAMGSPPREIIVELGREVGLGPKRRNEWESLSAKNQRLRRAAHEAIVEHGGSGTSSQIRRYLLWQEQGTHCPYCTQTLSMEDILDGGATHVEHIVPRSLTQVGMKRSEIVIAHASCNNLKADRTPWQAFGHDPSRWTIIEERAKDLQKRKQYRKAKLLLLKDFEQEVLTDASIADFVDRQLHQTSWIARAVAQWLGALSPNVFAARGEFTALLRRSWNLDTVIPEVRYANGLAVLDTDGQPITQEQFKDLRSAWEGHGSPSGRALEKRLDHRHHLVDALVIGLTSRGLYQRLARRYKETQQEIRQGSSRRRLWQVEPPLPDVRQVAMDLVQQCRLTHKPDRFPAGALFQDTAYAVHRDAESGKESLVSRAALSDLVVESSAESTRKNIHNISSSQVRDLVLAAFDTRVAQGKTPKEALSEPIEFPGYRTRIRKVRVVRTDVGPEKARAVEFHSRNGRHHKLLLPGGNAYLELLDDGRRVKPRIVSLPEAWDAAKNRSGGAVRFYKGDTVTDTKDGTVLVVRQIKSAAGGLLVLTPAFETRPVRLLSASDGLKVISGAGLKRLVLTNVLTPGAFAGGATSPQP